MKNFLKRILHKPITICIIVIILITSGIFAAINMPVNLIPNMKMPILGVTIVYPGASAHSVQEQVTSPLEDHLKAMSNVDSISTYSMDNVSMVLINFDYDIDIDKTINKLEKIIDGIALPQECEDAEISTIDFNASSIATISISHKGNMTQTCEDAKLLQDEIKKINGVEKVTLSGLPVSSISIEPNKGFELSTLLLVQALKMDSLDIPLGSIVKDGEYISIRNESKAINVEQIDNLPISLPFSQKEIDAYKQYQTFLSIDKNKLLQYSDLINISFPDKTDEEIIQILSATAPQYQEFLTIENIKLLRNKPYLEQILNDQEQIDSIKSINFDKYNSDNGTLLVKLADIASVHQNTDYTSIAKFNGEAGVNLDIYCASNANLTQVVDNVKRTMKDTKADFNLKSDITLINDQAQFIKDSISNMLSSMIIGGILAILVIYLFLRKVRTSLVISITMPLAVLMALICMHLMGITLNMVSIGGLAVGIGMLIDNSIVVIESIIRRRDKGEGVFSSAYNGVIDVAGSLFASTLTTVCVFFPILFTSGLTKEIFSDLAWSVVFSLSFSLVVALTIIPTLYCLVYRKESMLGGSILSDSPIENNKENNTIPTQNIVENHNSLVVADKKHKKPKKEKKQKANVGAFTIKMEHMYENVLRKCMNKKLLVVIITLIAFLSSIVLVFTTGVEFLPSIDQGVLEVNINCGSTASVEDAEKTTDQVYDIIHDNIDNIDIMSASIGHQGMLATSNTGYIKLQMKKGAKPTKEVVEDIRALVKEIPDATISISEIDGIVASLTSGMSGLSVTISGKDNHVLKEISDKVHDKLLKVEGFTEMRDDITQESSEYSIKFDKQKCAQYNIDYMVLVQTLRTGIAGLKTGTIEQDNNLIDVNVKFNDSTITTLDDLKNFVVGGTPTAPITINDVATITTSQKVAIIKKSNDNLLMTLTAGTYGIDTGKASKEFNRVVSEVLQDYDGYTFSASGVQFYLGESFKGLLIALIISVFLLYGVMACQFESFVKPFIVMMSIPITFTGAFLAIFITRTTLNLVSFIGIIMLMGVIVNNAIIMLDKIKQLTDEGMDQYEAVIKGCSSRLRAILMTSLTTILALLPLSLGLGKGGELMQPMGIAVMGGLILGCLVTLVLIPAIYMGIKKIKKPANDLQNSTK